MRKLGGCLAVSLVLALMAGCGDDDATTAKTSDAGTSTEGGAVSTPGNDAGVITTTTTDAGTGCTLTITDGTGSNVELMEFPGGAPLGSTVKDNENGTVKGASMTSGANTTDAVRTITFGLNGPAPVSGQMFTSEAAADQSSGLLLAINNVTTGELRTWQTTPGQVIIATTVGPGPNSLSYNVTLTIDHVAMTPRTAATNNKATGDFKISGSCSGSIIK